MDVDVEELFSCVREENAALVSLELISEGAGRLMSLVLPCPVLSVLAFDAAELV